MIKNEEIKIPFYVRKKGSDKRKRVYFTAIRTFESKVEDLK